MSNSDLDYSDVALGKTMTDQLGEDLPQSRPSLHRAAAIRLPEDSRVAAAQALAFIRGDDSFQASGALEALSARIEVIRDDDRMIDELAAHMPILEALFLRYSAEGVAASHPDHRGRYLRMALSAQTAYTRTAALVAGLEQQRKGRGTVTVVDGDHGPGE